MKFKKTITLAILAAVLSANLASCVVNRDPQDTDTDAIYTDENGGKNTLPVDPTNPADQDNYTTVSKTVYVSKKSTLNPVDTTGNTVTLDPATRLDCIAESATWYKVRYQGVEYYIARGRTTDDDIDATTFTSVSKTMYVSSDYLNIRKYPSAEDFSTILASKEKNDELLVVAESTSKGWCKVQFTLNGQTAYGFVNPRYLSDTKGGENPGWLEKFTAITETTMYVSVDQAVLRAAPIRGENGGKEVKVLKKGDAVTVVAEGTVDSHSWYMVKYRPAEGTASQQCYIDKTCVQKTVPGEKATLEQLMEQYPELKRFDNNEVKTVYTSGNVWARSAPTCEKDSKGNQLYGLDILEKKTEVKIVAYGKIKGIDPDGKDAEMTWCVAQNDKWGYYFVSFGYLTPNSDGTPGTIALSLDQLIQSYGFTKVNNASMKVKSGKTAPGLNTPDGSTVKSFAAGTTLTVVAKGKVGTEFVSDDWYIVEFEGSYYFVMQSLLELA